MSGSEAHRIADVAVAACWLVAAVVWIVGAVYNARRAPSVERRSRAGTIWILAAVVIWIVVRTMPTQDWDAIATHAKIVRLAGVVILVGSTAFTLWARVALGTMWSSHPSARSHHELRTDGPYAITRHPIYTGLLGMLFGTTLAVGLGVYVVLLAGGVLFVEVRIHAEERLLGEVFPVAYAEYRRTVPQLVPGLRLGRHRRRG